MVGGDSKGGFAVVDALTALTILATTIALTIGAADVARRLAASALESRLARGALDYLTVEPISKTGVRTGRDSRFDWALSLAPYDARGADGVVICRRTMELRSRTSGRGFEAATLEPCPIEARP